jgi:NAD(P)H-hydrate epimerase
MTAKWMNAMDFEIYLPCTGRWQEIPHVNEAQMREVDRVAVEVFHLGILQMMENAGRNLARSVYRALSNSQANPQSKKVVVFAGVGGNGGGGLCAGRHLHNHGVDVSIVITKPPETYTGAAQSQLSILTAAGMTPVLFEGAKKVLDESDLVLDAMIGYSLKGPPRGDAKTFIEWINQSGKPVISLDLPSGLDATTGKTPGACIHATQTLSLALPKPGLANPLSGDLFLADIGIPPEVYHSLGITFDPFFSSEYILQMRAVQGKL